MPTSSISETKKHLSALLDQVRAGETITITNRGRPIARIVPAIDASDEDARVARLERAGLMTRPLKKLDVEAFLAMPRGSAGTSLVEAVLEERAEDDR